VTTGGAIPDSRCSTKCKGSCECPTCDRGRTVEEPRADF
jgi:hypothetical protein